MRDVPAPDDVLSWHVRVESLLGDRPLDGDIPVMGGSLAWATAAPVLEESTLRVPDEDGRWWPRTDPDHPLARFGQRLQYVLELTPAEGPAVQVPLARHRVHEWDVTDDGVVNVAARSTLAALAEDELAWPVSSAPGPITTAVASVLPTWCQWRVTHDLPVPVVPGTTFGESRTEALGVIAESWPARVRLDEWGRVVFRAPLPDLPDPVLELTDGEGGTVVRTGGLGDTRDGQANTVVAEGKDPETDVEFRHVAQVTQGPLAPARYGVVVERVGGDLVTSQGSAVDVARAALAESVRRAVVWQVHTPPDWRVQVDDPVRVTVRGESRLGFVVGVQMPLVPGGLSRVDVGVVA